MSANLSPVVFHSEGPVGIIELARPEKFNCVSPAVCVGLDAALDHFEAAGSGVRVLLLRAQGSQFSTGADLQEVKGLRQDPAALTAFLTHGHQVLRRMEASRLPVVAACHGLCLAGGLELMLACDVVFAASSARFGDQHAQFGLVPGWGGSQRLPRIIGLRRAMDLLYSARWLSAQEAHAMGLVNHLCDPDKLAEESMAYCQQMAQRSREGLALMKQLARQGLEGSLSDGLQLEEELAVPVLLGDDVGEGLAAFEARRKPNFAV
jgi:enoyl-CoA hydratase